jgi:alpha-glucosidase (family GH31 glycosyl hydrolase)
VWTADIVTHDESLKATTAMLLAYGVCGFGMVGCDVGGFVGDPSEELWVNWNQQTVFHPFFRNHSAKITKRREPWLFGAKALEIVRANIYLRYRLLPYLYTAIKEHSVFGIPFMRPLWMEYPNHEDVFSEESMFVCGDAILVHPDKQYSLLNSQSMSS